MEARWKRGDAALYCPKGIDWDAQYNRAVKLVGEGSTVWVHRHGTNGGCPPRDAVEVCYRLTPGQDRAILGPDSTTGTNEEPENDN